MSLLLISTAISMSSGNWLFVWIGLEVNLLSFIPIIITRKATLSTEAATKYFIAQAIGSSALLITAIIILYPAYSAVLKLAPPTLVIAIMVKLGVPPLHFWLPQVMASLTWLNALVLRTWQKVAPLIILIILVQEKSWAYIAILIPVIALTGSMGGLNQSQVRPLIAFSSISHISWILITFFVSFSAGIVYFISYMIISSCLIMSASYGANINSLSLTPYNPPIEIVKFFLILLSLGGLPPLFGFFPKWLRLACLTNNNFLFISLLLLGRALINLFYYLRLSFNFILSAQPREVSLNPSMASIRTLSISRLPLIPALYTLF